MGTIEIKRSNGVFSTPAKIKLGNQEFVLKAKQTKTLELPEGYYKLDIDLTKIYSKSCYIKVENNKTLEITIEQLLPRSYVIFAILSVIALWGLSKYEILSNVFYGSAFFLLFIPIILAFLRFRFYVNIHTEIKK